MQWHTHFGRVEVVVVVKKAWCGEKTAVVAEKTAVVMKKCEMW
jgi:hypothetical protein